MHPEPHPLAGKAVVLNDKVATDPRLKIKPGEVLRVEDWVDRLGEKKSWKAEHNWATAHYAARQRLSQEGPEGKALTLPADEEVVYGHIGNLGHCVHALELGEEI